MRSGTRARKTLLTAHIVASVGWLGAVAVFLALAIAGLASSDPLTVRSAYLAMESIGWFVLVPLSLASLATGTVQALTTKWGLFQHYWVIAKLLINLLATVILLLYMDSLGALADLAVDAEGAASVPADLQSPSPVLHAGAALILLAIATALSVFKPAGLTRYGWRKRYDSTVDVTPRS
jgi:hypothetical protein